METLTAKKKAIVPMANPPYGEPKFLTRSTTGSSCQRMSYPEVAMFWAARPTRPTPCSWYFSKSCWASNVSFQKSAKALGLSTCNDRFSWLENLPEVPTKDRSRSCSVSDFSTMRLRNHVRCIVKPDGVMIVTHISLSSNCLVTTTAFPFERTLSLDMLVNGMYVG